jgi:pimeloyl-ACP methyl ester carboxylesterase
VTLHAIKNIWICNPLHHLVPAGHGATGGQALPPDSRGAFLQALLQALQVQQPLVIVTPSMSGTYILPWLADHAENLAAWVAVAPVGLQQWVQKGALQAASQRPQVSFFIAAQLALHHLSVRWWSNVKGLPLVDWMCS